MSSIKVNIGNIEYNRCVEFADLCYNTNKDEYARRNQFDRSKIINDIIIGKLGEIAVYHYLCKKRNIECEYPDFEIYSKEYKSFDSDIRCEKYNIHVKSQNISSAEKFGDSWQFQKKDKLTFDPEPNDLICLTTVCNNIVEIKKIVYAKDIVDKYKEPVLEKLRTTKTTLYLKDI